MADWIFNGVTRIIKEPNVGAGNLTWNAERDIYSAWKRWAQDNSQYLKAFNVEGGTGNLFSDDGIDVVPNPNFSASLKTFGSVNAQGIATGSAVTEQDKTDIIDGVWNKEICP
jgi:hypothetical protein